MTSASAANRITTSATTTMIAAVRDTCRFFPSAGSAKHVHPPRAAKVGRDRDRSVDRHDEHAPCSSERVARALIRAGASDGRALWRRGARGNGRWSGRAGERHPEDECEQAEDEGVEAYDRDDGGGK